MVRKAARERKEERGETSSVGEEWTSFESNGSLLKPDGTSSFLLALRIRISFTAVVACSGATCLITSTFCENAFVSETHREINNYNHKDRVNDLLSSCVWATAR